MNFDEVKYQIQNPVVGDILTFEFGDALAIDTPIIEVHGDNILVYTDEIAGKLLNTLEAEYQGKKVDLGKVKRGGDKKFYVYVKDPTTKNIKKVSFGDTTGLSIKTKDPDKRRNFRARHNCDNPGPKTKARYWSCRMWSGPDAVKNMLKK